MQEQQNIDPTKRFTSRVENYVKYRPHYPKAVIDTLRDECGLTPEWRVADIGSGTGFLTELFLQNGNATYAVEPNQAMREAAEKYLSQHDNFISLDGTAENTTLVDSSVDLISAGQAFHWFDRVESKEEFQRILKPGGWVVLVWNERITDTPFLSEYEKLLQQFAIDYNQVRHRNIDEQVLNAFFSQEPYQLRIFKNSKPFDFNGVKGGLLSSSYSPEPGHPAYESMITKLKQIFNLYQENGKVVYEYNTQVYFGRLK